MTSLTLNKSELAKCIGRPLKTIDDWLLRGCPHTKLKGQYRFIFHEVWAWREEDIERQCQNRTNDGLDLEQEQARKLRELADKTAMDNDNLKQDLLSSAEADDAWQWICRRIQDRFSRLPDSLAAALVNENRPAVCQSIMDRGVREALTELSEIYIAIGDFYDS